MVSPVTIEQSPASGLREACPALNVTTVPALYSCDFPTLPLMTHASVSWNSSQRMEQQACNPHGKAQLSHQPPHLDFQDPAPVSMPPCPPNLPGVTHTSILK